MSNCDHNISPKGNIIQSFAARHKETEVVVEHRERGKGENKINEKKMEGRNERMS